MTHRRLAELDFVDIYVCLEGEGEPHYCRLAANKIETALPVPDAFRESVNSLTAFLLAKMTEDEMGFTFEDARQTARFNGTNLHCIHSGSFLA